MTRRRILARALVVALCAGVFVTCQDSSSPPPPGWLDVRLITPNLDDGGVHFSISGARIDSIRTTYPYFVAREAADAEWGVVVGGTLSGGVIARIWVPDTRQVDKYETQVLEVATRGTLAQRATTGYSIEIARDQ